MHAPLPTAPCPTVPAAPFRLPLRVYWEDTDAGGVVFYANYLKYFERTRTEWLRSLGFSQQQMLRDDGVMFVVTDTALHYRRAARLDDLLEVTVQQVQAGRASLQLSQQVLRAGVLLAEGDIRLACVHAAQDEPFRPSRIPRAILQKIT